LDVAAESWTDPEELFVPPIFPDPDAATEPSNTDDVDVTTGEPAPATIAMPS
jgi:hypothetical protein